MTALSRRFLLAALLCGPLLLGGLAQAQSLDTLLTSGQAGERYDGYLEARVTGVTARVEEINNQRRAIYQQRAAEQGVAVGDVGLVYGQEIISRAPSGTWIKLQNGQWTQK